MDRLLLFDVRAYKLYLNRLATQGEGFKSVGIEVWGFRARTSDREVTAHDILLMASSPVLRVMLESSMVEGKQKRIKVKDAASGGVSLFVEMLYTNATWSRLD